MHPFQHHCRDALERMKAEGRYRSFAALAKSRRDFPRYTDASGRQVTVWSSNDYLGLGGSDVLAEAALAAIEQHGVGSGGTWVSLTGLATVVNDPAKKKELWNSAVEAWFPQGPEDPSVVLLKVDGNSAEYWDSPGGRLATAFSFVKAKATGERIDGGENEKVDL